MPRSAPIQTSFAGGELSTLAQGRTKDPRYQAGLAAAERYLPGIQESLIRKPGSRYIATGKFAQFTRMIPFELSTTIAYMIEMGDQYFRFFVNEAVVGAPYEVAHPFLLADLPRVRYFQNEKDIYFLHPNYAPRKLTYTSSASWALTTVAFQDGPYLPKNKEATTMQVNSVGPTGITLTASAVTGINGGAGFAASDVGRLVRLNQTTVAYTAGAGGVQSVKKSVGDAEITWTGSGTALQTNSSWYVITAFTSTTVVTVSRFGPNGILINTASDSDWRLGVFKIANYPACGTIHEGRMFLSGMADEPRRVVGSVSNDYENFAYDDAISGLPNTVLDSSSLNFIPNTTRCQVIQWLEGDEKGLLAGSQGDELTIRPSTLSEAMTPFNIDVKPVTAFGSSANVAPVRVGKSVIFAQRYSKKIREMGFYFEVNGYRAPERTKFAEHITGTNGIKEMAYAKEPHSIVWAVRNDGLLIGMTHDEEDGVTKVGWHRHPFGGTDTVQSVAVIPSADSTWDQLWMTTLRTVNGSTVCYIEAQQKFWSPYEDVLKDAWYVDCAKKVTAGSPFTLVTGLTHLVAATVGVWGDGAYQGDFVVDGSGHITLPVACSQVIVGYRRSSRGQMLRLDSGSADGTSIGKIRRTSRVGFILDNITDFGIGPDLNHITPVVFRGGDDLADTGPLFSGIKLEEIDMDYDFENKIAFQQDGCGPGTILAIMPRMDTQDAG